MCQPIGWREHLQQRKDDNIINAHENIPSTKKRVILHNLLHGIDYAVNSPIILTIQFAISKTFMVG